jgi:hypothetical protein
MIHCIILPVDLLLSLQYLLLIEHYPVYELPFYGWMKLFGVQCDFILQTKPLDNFLSPRFNMNLNFLFKVQGTMCGYNWTTLAWMTGTTTPTPRPTHSGLRHALVTSPKLTYDVERKFVTLYFRVGVPGLNPRR